MNKKNKKFDKNHTMFYLLDEKHDVSLYSLINCMCGMPLEDLSFRQWRCYAKIKMSSKLRIKRGITSTRTFTLQVQSSVGEP